MIKEYRKQTIQLALTLFSMFFGAGNLIFAPFLGAQAGAHGLGALAGFLLTGVVFPIGAIVIISRFESAQKMISRISPKLAVVFLVLVNLLIGPVIAIPRTASTSFEMLSWLLEPTALNRVVYTLLFFAACAAAALRPGRLKNILGRIMGPLLLVLIGIISLGALSIPFEVTGAQGAYAQAPFWEGFVQGYQTMDLLGSFCVGLVLSLNIAQLGLPTKQKQEKMLVHSAVLAGVLLASIYILLALMGMFHSGKLYSLTNGAQIWSYLASSVYGPAGQVLNSLIFLAACFNVCSGLLSCSCEYFFELCPKVPYRLWLLAFSAIGAANAFFGLDAILSWSAPLLSVICSLAVGLVLFGLGVLVLGNGKAEFEKLGKIGRIFLGK